MPNPELPGNAPKSPADDPTAWLSYRDWFRGEGLPRLISAWRRLLGCLAAGVLLAWAVPLRMADVAASVAAPFGSLLIGMAFAWSVTVTSLLQSKGGQEFGAMRGGLHFRTFVMKYHFTLATIFGVTILWALVGLQAFTWLALHVPSVLRLSARAMVFGLTAVMLTEMWDAIADVQRMMLTVEYMRRVTETPPGVPAAEASAPASQSEADPSTGVRVPPTEVMDVERDARDLLPPTPRRSHEQ